MKSKIKISDEKALSIIHKPLLTEKSTNLNQFNQYTFVVDRKSNSSEIQQAIEKIFISQDVSRKKRSSNIDKHAACWILQSALDFLKKR